MTDRAVLKWDVPVDDKTHQIGSGDVVHVARQHYDDVVTVWTIEPRSGARARRCVQVFGTGHPLPFFAKHLGTALAAEGNLVWHLFELPDVPEVVEDVELPRTTEKSEVSARVAP